MTLSSYTSAHTATCTQTRTPPRYLLGYHLLTSSLDLERTAEPSRLLKQILKAIVLSDYPTIYGYNSTRVYLDLANRGYYVRPPVLLGEQYSLPVAGSTQSSLELLLPPTSCMFLTHSQIQFASAGIT